MPAGQNEVKGLRLEVVGRAWRFILVDSYLEAHTRRFILGISYMEVHTLRFILGGSNLEAHPMKTCQGRKR